MFGRLGPEFTTDCLRDFQMILSPCFLCYDSKGPGLFSWPHTTWEWLNTALGQLDTVSTLCQPLLLSLKHNPLILLLLINLVHTVCYGPCVSTLSNVLRESPAMVTMQRNWSAFWNTIPRVEYWYLILSSSFLLFIVRLNKPLKESQMKSQMKS